PGIVGVATLEAGRRGRVQAAAARRAMQAALTAATGAATGEKAAAMLFAPADTVGIKLNCLGGRWLSPHPELVEALAVLIGAAGVPPDRILVFERSSRELRRAGFSRGVNAHYRCLGIDNDYEPEPAVSGEIGSCYATIVSRRCTALVSFGVVKDHDLAGVSAGLKNWYGVIHNPNKYHDNNCDPYVADVVNYPWIRDKLRLTVLDGTLAQYHGGPAFNAAFTWPLGRIVASTDPVAADAWAWKVLDAERKRRGKPSLEADKRTPRFILTAARYGLGVGDPSKIREVRA
ncbi:MAG: DUF362 domain-containing protein, partial [Acidobacteria bacterium]|nr:DUF362 domain-containing protein [Acidobacteriota bacterium]